MTIPRLELIRAKEIGAFDRSNEFIDAPIAVLEEMRDTHQRWYEEQDRQVRMGDLLDFYDAAEAPGSKIYASFLERVGADLQGIVGDHEAMREVQAVPYLPKLEMTGIPSSVRWIHRDSHETDAQIGIRYIAASHSPTVIPELGRTQAGSIYRMANKYTFHRQPKFQHAAGARALFAINI